MAKVSVELPGELIYLIDRQAKKDGHENRSAVVRKAVNCFIAGAPPAGEVPDSGIESGKSIVSGIDIPDELITLLDERARRDGHSNRGAVVRKAINYFFAR